MRTRPGDQTTEQRSAEDGSAAGSTLAAAAPIAVASLPFVVLLVASIVQAGRVSATSGDLAALQLRVHAAAHFQELLGPYSRYGWDHPGPLSFYWAAPFYALSGERPGGLAVAAIAANLAWVVLIVAAVQKAAGRAAAWVAAATLLAFASLLGVPWLRQAWNPFEVILPVTAMAVCAAAVWRGVRWALPAAMVAATWAVQTHIGAAAPVLAILLVTVAPAAWHERHAWRTWRPALIATVVGGLVLWLPPLIEQTTHRPGNLRTLVRFFRASSGTTHPFRDVLRLVAPQLTLTSRDLGAHLGSSVRHFRPVDAGMLVLLGLLAAALVAGAWRARRAGDHFTLGLCLAGLAGSAASVFATRAAAGDLLPYFTAFATGVGVVSWLALAMTVVREARRRGAEDDPAAEPARAPSRLAGAARIAAAAVLGLGAVTLSVDAARARSFASTSNHPEVARLAVGTRSALGAKVDRPVLIVVGANRPWPTAAGLAVELQRAGITVRTTKPWVFLFGDQYRSRGDEKWGLLVIGPSHHRWPAAPPGAVLVGRVGAARVWKLPAPAASHATVRP